MTIEEIRKRVGNIAAIADDDERAHDEEDRLYRDVLRAIADDMPGDQQAWAREALETENIEFARWMA